MIRGEFKESEENAKNRGGFQEESLTIVYSHPSLLVFLFSSDSISPITLLLRRFEPIINFRKETGEYWVDYSRFNSTYEVDTPLCSASELDHFRKVQTESVQSK